MDVPTIKENQNLTSLSEGTVILALGFTTSTVSFLCKNSSSSSTTACVLVDGCGSRLNKVGLFSSVVCSISGFGTSLATTSSENI